MAVRFRIAFEGDRFRWKSAFQSNKGDIGTELTITLYEIAEWIASSWWPLLFEPRKTDPDQPPRVG